MFPEESGGNPAIAVRQSPGAPVIPTSGRLDVVARIEQE